MTTITAPATRRRTTTGKLTAAGVVRSEWIKLRTVRSTLWCYGLLILLVIGVGVLISSLSDFGGGKLTGDAARSLARRASSCFAKTSCGMAFDGSVSRPR